MKTTKRKHGNNVKVRGIMTMLAVSFFMVPFFFTPATVIAKNNFGEGLVGWWLLDEGVGVVTQDSSGFGNDGSLSGGASFTADALLGSALDFTSGDGTLMVPYDVSLQPAVGTIQVWIKIATMQNSDIVFMGTNCAVRTDPSCSVPIGISVIGLRITKEGIAYAFIANDDPSKPGPWVFAVSPPGFIQTGKWHHLAMRWDGDTVDVFVDGVLRGSEPYDPVPALGLSYHGESPLYFGVPTAWGIPIDDFIGQIDDIRFYSHARRDVEIYTDFVTKGHKPGEPGGR